MNKKDFCPLPFVQSVQFPDGDITPCCHLEKYHLGNVKERSYEEIRNGPKARALRREFLEGKPKTCAANMRNLKCHLKNDHLKKYVQRSEIQTTPPVKLDLRLNGHCNLECITCEIWKYPNGVYDQSGFWEYAAKELFPHVVEIDVLGGEPFIQRDTFRLIQEVSLVNPNCRWAFVTNGQWKFNDTIRGHLERIQIRWMILSIDSLKPEVFRKIRLKGELSKSLRTLDDLCRYRDSSRKNSTLKLHMNMVVQLANYEEVPAYIEFARGQGVEPGLVFCFYPREMSVLSLKPLERRRLLDSYEALYSETREECVTDLIRPLRASLDPERWIAAGKLEKSY